MQNGDFTDSHNFHDFTRGFSKVPDGVKLSGEIAENIGIGRIAIFDIFRDFAPQRYLRKIPR